MVYLEPDAAYAAAQELARKQGGALPVTPRTLWKRLDEAGRLAAKDKDRNTYKASIGNRRINTIALLASHLAPKGGQLGQTGPGGEEPRDGAAPVAFCRPDFARGEPGNGTKAAATLKPVPLVPFVPLLRT
jgi:hypothetical protein